MIFNVTRASGFPIIIEMEEQHAMDVLEEQERWQELEELERDLRRTDDLKEIKVECERLDEILILLSSLNHMGSISINFTKKTIVIEDNGKELQ